jgi:hypothetical protein
MISERACFSEQPTRQIISSDACRNLFDDRGMTSVRSASQGGRFSWRSVRASLKVTLPQVVIKPARHHRSLVVKFVLETIVMMILFHARKA